MAQAGALDAHRKWFITTPGRDFLFFFASVSVVMVAWFAATVLHVNSFYILATVAVVANGPHLASTWTRVYFDSREWKQHKVTTVVVPLLIAATVVCITLFAGPVGTRLLNSTILYWATWHFVAQNWGIMRIYQRKSGEPETSTPMKLEKPILYLFVLWCVLHRILTGPRVLFGTEVFYVDLPAPVVDGLLGPLLFLVAIYLWHRFKQRHEAWAKPALIRMAFLFCAFLGFFIPFQLIKTDDTSAFAAAACWHGIQYLGIIRHYHRNAWKAGVHQDAKVISFVSQPGWGRTALYTALLLALIGSGYVVIFIGSQLTKGTFLDEYTWGLMVWVSFTLSHYWLDGVIWKLRRPELANRVGIQT